MDQWLLMHKHDEYAVKGWNPEDYPRSVLSGRDAGIFRLFLEAYADGADKYGFGREPDRTPSQPWAWPEPGRSP